MDTRKYLEPPCTPPLRSGRHRLALVPTEGSGHMFVLDGLPLLTKDGIDGAVLRQPCNGLPATLTVTVFVEVVANEVNSHA